MSVKPIVLRQAADRDIEAATRFYVREAGRPVALRFLDEIDRALAAIGRTPAIGSPRYAHELATPGLRTRILQRFPFLIFYREENDHIDVWRILHAQRDIPGQWGEGDASTGPAGG
ncbi:MAG: type II toxin-antitoxin system RelE/ParE family toxin [Pseudomonadota bacterium]